MDLPRLEEFEKAVYCRPGTDRIAENKVALDALSQCLWPLREGAHFAGHDYYRDARASYTRMASAIVALFCDPGFRLTREGFDHIAGNHSVIETIFAASAYESSDFVFKLVTEKSEYVNKYLLLFGMNSELDLDLEAVFREDPQGTFGLYLSLLGYPHILTPQSDARRQKLITMASIFEDVTPSTGLYNALCGAYMHLSYAHGPDKHAPKRLFHTMLRRVLDPHVEESRCAPVLKKDQPTIVMVFEWWHSTHAMYRSYAQSIRQLKRDFRIIGCCPGTNTDDIGRELFDEWIDFDGASLVLADIAKKIRSFDPDILYYPSIGMAVWVIALSSMRLAPIQVMSYGHPATSNSPQIDYGIIEADCYVQDRFSEKVITLPPNTVRPTPAGSITARHTPRRSEVIRIGVAAMQVKVTWPFIQALMMIQDCAEKKVEIVFFSAVYGVGLFAYSQHLEKRIANLTVQERQHYPDYMQSLAECDICLFSFPFGGANSVYDAVELGIPMVSMEGLEPHERSDASIIRRCGLPESLIAHTPDEYAAAVLDLLDDDRRIAVANQVAAVDLKGQFFKADDSGAFVDAFARIYRENTVVQVPNYPIYVKEAA